MFIEDIIERNSVLVNQPGQEALRIKLNTNGCHIKEIDHKENVQNSLVIKSVS